MRLRLRLAWTDADLGLTRINQRRVRAARRLHEGYPKSEALRRDVGRLVKLRGPGACP